MMREISNGCSPLCDKIGIAAQICDIEGVHFVAAFYVALWCRRTGPARA
jgi:hypothetical protein